MNRVLLCVFLCGAACGKASGPQVQDDRKLTELSASAAPNQTNQTAQAAQTQTAVGPGEPASAGDEEADKNKLDAALSLLSQHDLQGARRLFAEVARNTPQRYVYSYEAQGKRIVRLWDENELAAYVAWQRSQNHRQEVVFVRSVYPRAYYYLGFIDVELQAYDQALTDLSASLRLEPDQPKSLCEMAAIYSKLRQYQRAIQIYDQVLQTRPYLTDGQRARALRGKGVELINLNQLDAATEYLQKSLQYEPDSELAHNELAYIKKLRETGQVPDPNDSDLVVTSPQQKTSPQGSTKEKGK